MFSLNLDANMIQLFANLLDICPVSVHSQYLGLPLVIGANRKDLFRKLEDKMNKRVQDWKIKILSWAGREVLIKSCLQSMPLYEMTCCKFPKTLCDNMSSLTLQFWWNVD